MGEVLEFLIDGQSGLAPGGVEGAAIVAGICSKGEVGKGYLLGKRSNLKNILGIGPLVDALDDIFSAGGQNPKIIAVPCQGMTAFYVSQVKKIGEGPLIKVSGNSSKSFKAIIEVTKGGALNEAKIKLSADNGSTFTEEKNISLNGFLNFEGLKIEFSASEENPFIVGTRYTFETVGAISPLHDKNQGPEITVLGQPKAKGHIVLKIIKGGGLNEGVYEISIDGGHNYSQNKTLPLDGLINLPLLGVDLQLKAGLYQSSLTYEWEILAPVLGLNQVMEALENPLEIYDTEFVYIVGASNRSAWAAGHALAQNLWNNHRPVYFKFESRLPYKGEDLNDWAESLIRERANFASYFVQVCAQFGAITDRSGLTKIRNLGALQAGKTLANPVQRAAGRVRDGAIGQVILPTNWNESLQKTLEDAGFLTAKKYAGLKGAYWGDSRTMAEITSDFQYEEVLRVTFKALRKCRVAALKSLYDDLGDPLSPDGAAGLNYLKANLEMALDTMTMALPPEMASYQVDIPEGQDFVNNGVGVELTFIGIPIIRQIKLFGRYVYAGSKFDPRLEKGNFND